MLSTEGKNTSRCSFSSSGVLSTVNSNSFKEIMSWLSKKEKKKHVLLKPSQKEVSWSILAQASDSQLTSNDLERKIVACFLI